MRTLGLPVGDDYSFADDINLSGQVVGGAGAFNSAAGQHGAVWLHGAAYDLNTLVAPTTLHITEAEYINNRGEIAAKAVLPPNANGVTYQRAVLLIPADEADREGIVQNTPPRTSVAPAVAQSSATSCPTVASLLAQFKPEPVRARLARSTHPTCLGS